MMVSMVENDTKLTFENTNFTKQEFQFEMVHLRSISVPSILDVS
jgi:hypothetical protein